MHAGGVWGAACQACALARLRQQLIIGIYTPQFGVCWGLVSDRMALSDLFKACCFETRLSGSVTACDVGWWALKLAVCMMHLSHIVQFYCDPMLQYADGPPSSSINWRLCVASVVFEVAGGSVFHYYATGIDVPHGDGN
jgi:hypothetical protein